MEVLILAIHGSTWFLLLLAVFFIGPKELIKNKKKWVWLWDNLLTPVVSKSYLVSPYISLWEFIWGVNTRQYTLVHGF